MASDNQYSPEVELISEETSEQNNNQSQEIVSEHNSVRIYERAISSTTKYGTNAQRLLRTVIGLIHPDDQPGKTVYTFPVREFQRLYGLKNYPAKQLFAAAEELGQRFTIADPKNPKNGTVTGWIDKLEIYEGIATVYFQKDLLPVYQKIQKLTYSLGNTSKFKTSYTFSFYEKFLAELKDANSVRIYLSIEEIRKWLKIENQYLKTNGTFHYAAFRAKIIDKVKAEINGTEEERPCNITVEVSEYKQGRRVLGLYFDIVRIRIDTYERPIRNLFYERLRPETRRLYDIALENNVKPYELETCILNYSEDVFCEIMQYNLTKNANKGTAYWTACIRNGWRDSKSNNNFNFKNLQKTVAFADDIYKSYKNFLMGIELPKQKKVLAEIGKSLKNSQPQVYEYIKITPTETVLANEGVQILLLEALYEMISSHTPREIYDWYQEFENAASTPLIAPEVGLAISCKPATPSLPVERNAIIEVLNSFNITSVTKIIELLNYSDEHIQANIDYCVNRYQKGKGQEDISGAIITAVANDYAHYEANKFKIEQKKLKEREEKLKEEAVQNFLNAKAVMATEELEELLKVSAGNTKLINLINNEFEDRKKDIETKMLKEYFYSLSQTDQSEVIEIAKKKSNIAVNFFRGKSYEEIWNSSSLVGVIRDATRKFKAMSEQE